MDTSNEDRILYKFYFNRIYLSDKYNRTNYDILSICNSEIVNNKIINN